MTSRFTDLRTFLRETEARTDPAHEDLALRGRTYAIPFQKVWTACLQLTSGRLARDVPVLADEMAGIIRVECGTYLARETDQVEVRISLDENAQTRVDMASRAPSQGPGARLGMGRHSRRIRRFFRLLDREVGAGPGLILDPTISLIPVLVTVLILLGGCDARRETPPGAGEGEEELDTASRNFESRSYERDIVFLAVQGDSTLLAPFQFLSRSREDGVHREIRGWLARGDTWDLFLSEVWDGPPTRVPWRILPHGPSRLLVGMGDALETVIYQEEGRTLEVTLGELLVEWTGQRGQTFRIHEGSILLADQVVEGHLLDLSRAWRTDDPQSRDWGFLVSGDSVQVVFEDQSSTSSPEGGSFSLWTRIRFLHRQWQNVRLTWTDVRAFEAARRDVPMAWGLRSPEDELTGDLVAGSPFLEALEGEGPVLPVAGLYQVSGTLNLDGEIYPVRGLIRHLQR